MKQAKQLLGRLQKFRSEGESIIMADQSPEVARSFTAGLIAEVGWSQSVSPFAQPLCCCNYSWQSMKTFAMVITLRVCE